MFMTIEGLIFFLLLRYLYIMKDIKTLIREGLNNYINEAERKNKKEQDIPLPKGCFGGPKSELGALISLVELLLKEKDADGQRAVDDLKQFLKGTKKIIPEHVAGILRKHHKTQFIHWVGCL
jgi:hypothetical protein